MLESMLPEPNTFAVMIRMCLTAKRPRFLLIFHFRTARRHMRHAVVVDDGIEKPDSRGLTSLHALPLPLCCL